MNVPLSACPKGTFEKVSDGVFAVVALLSVGLWTLAVGVILFYTLLALAQGYSWTDMDWNGDGRTTLGEFYYGIDTIRRPVARGALTCEEIIDLKGGRTMRVTCPGDLPTTGP